MDGKILVTFAGCWVIRFSQKSLIAACGAFVTACGASDALPFVAGAMVAFSVTAIDRRWSGVWHGQDRLSTEVDSEK